MINLKKLFIIGILASGLVVTGSQAASLTGPFATSSNIWTNLPSRVLTSSYTGSVTIVGTLNATVLTGKGSAITSLNATQLTSGTVPSARMSGSYTGITGVGTVTTGTWNSAIQDNLIVSADISASQIKTGHILDGTITGTDIGSNTITSSNISASQIKTGHILDGTVSGTDIGSNTITSSNISASQIKTGHILDGTIASVDIADNTIVSSDIAASQIKNTHLTAGSYSNITGLGTLSTLSMTGRLTCGEVYATSSVGLKLFDDGGNGLTIADGGGATLSGGLNVGLVTGSVNGMIKSQASGNSYSASNLKLINSSGVSTTSFINATGILFISNDGTTDHFQMGATGAVTLSNSLTVSTGLNVGTATGATAGQIKTSDHIFVNASAARLYLTSTVTTNYNAITFNNSGGNFYMGMEGNPGASLLPAATAYSAIINHAGNYPIYFGTNNSIRMTIANDGTTTIANGLNVGTATGAGTGDILTSGEVGVKTNTPQGTLGVVGDVYVTGNIYELYRGSGEIGCSYNVTAMNLVQNVYMDVTKNMITNPDSALVGMTHSNGVVTISTNYGGRYLVIGSMTVSRTAASDDLHIGISKNNATPLGIHESNLTTNTSSDCPVPVQAILTLAAGDTIRLKIENTTNSNDCTVTHCSLILKEI